jgi:hypothetical protein
MASLVTVERETRGKARGVATHLDCCLIQKSPTRRGSRLTASGKAIDNPQLSTVIFPSIYQVDFRNFSSQTKNCRLSGASCRLVPELAKVSTDRA